MRKIFAGNPVKLGASCRFDVRRVVTRVAQRDPLAIHHQIVIPSECGLQSARLGIADAIAGRFNGGLREPLYELGERPILLLAAQPANPSALRSPRNAFDARIFRSCGPGHFGTRGDCDVAVSFASKSPTRLLAYFVELRSREVHMGEGTRILRWNAVKNKHQVLVLGRPRHEAVADPVARPAPLPIPSRVAGPYRGRSAQARQKDLLLKTGLALAIILRGAHLIIGSAVSLDIGAEQSGGGIVGHPGRVASSAGEFLLLLVL